MSNQKKLDFASIIIIVVSILLILSGLFLLNKGNKQVNEANITSSSSSSLIKEKSSETISSISQTISSSSSSEMFSSSSSSNTSSQSSSSLSSSSEKSKSKLSITEAIVKIISISGSQYDVEVIDTGYEEGKLWKKDSKFKIFLSDFSASVGSEYKLSGISESGNSTRFNLIEEIK
jgi:hypothetical protein